MGICRYQKSLAASHKDAECESGRCELRGALRAAPGLERDRRGALGAILAVRLLLRAMRHQRVVGPDHEEEDDGRRDQERDQGIDEVAVEELAAVDREVQ